MMNFEKFVNANRTKILFYEFRELHISMNSFLKLA